MEEITFGIFNSAIADFLREEVDNIMNDVHEINLCARLSIYLDRYLAQSTLVGYFADTEYNRKQNGEVKVILDGNYRVVPIKCDLLIHSRGAVIINDNLLAIEMKKSNRSRASKELDKDRLKALTKSSFNIDIWSNDGTTHPQYVCGYKVGMYIEMNLRRRTCYLERFREGKSLMNRMLSF